MHPDELFKWRLIRAQDLKDKREKSGLSIHKLSQLTGISRNTIHNIEKGKANWSIDIENILLSIYRLNRKGIKKEISKNC